MLTTFLLEHSHTLIHEVCIPYVVGVAIVLTSTAILFLLHKIWNTMFCKKKRRREDAKGFHDRFCRALFGSLVRYNSGVITYKKDKHFNRNQAIWVLYTIDTWSIETIAEEFGLPVEEVQKIVKEYEQKRRKVLEEV